MNANFRDWLTTNLSTEESKRALIQGLTFERDEVVKWISHNMPDWGTIACMELNQVIYSPNQQDDAEEFVRHLETIFASEIAVFNKPISS